jgi:hypothetical protein
MDKTIVLCTLICTLLDNEREDKIRILARKLQTFHEFNLVFSWRQPKEKRDQFSDEFKIGLVINQSENLIPEMPFFSISDTDVIPLVFHTTEYQGIWVYIRHSIRCLSYLETKVIPTFEWRERVNRKVFWLIMDKLIGQLGYHSSMALNCDLQFTYRVQCRNLDRQCDSNEGDKDCDTSILLEQRRISCRKEKVKGRYLLDSVACGAHYGRHVVRDGIYHLPFERWD